MRFKAALIVSIITLLITLLPIAFLMTILCAPLWLWVENTFHIEAIGHSGPAEWCYLLTYALCVGIALSFYKKIILLAMLSLVIIAIILVIPFPHGGSLGEALIHELSEAFEDIQQNQLEIKQEQFQRKSTSRNLKKRLTERFAGSLEFDLDFTQNHWQTGFVLGKIAWLDNNTGMIWGARQNIVLQGWSPADLQVAIAYCKKLAPQGYWSLPTNAEFTLGVKSKMRDYINDLTGKWIAQIYISGMINPMPSVVGFGNQSNNNIQRGSSVKSIRCIGRSESAPLHGYIRDDISNEDVLQLLTR